MKSNPAWWQLWTWVRIWWIESEIRSIDFEIEIEEKRYATHERRMRSWRAWRAEKLGRAQTLRRAPGSVNYSGMTGRNRA